MELAILTAAALGLAAYAVALWAASLLRRWRMRRKWRRIGETIDSLKRNAE